MAAEQLELLTLGRPELARIFDERIKFAQAMCSQNTRIAYDSDWKGFTAWCVAMDRLALPATAATVALYAADLLSRGYRVKGVTRRVCGVSYAQRAAGFAGVLSNPEVKAVLVGAQRLRQEQPNQKAAVTVAQLRRMCRRLDDGSPLGIRNRAVLLVGFASALRRSNIAGLRLDDVTIAPKGIVLTIRREKQDQIAAGRSVGIPRGGKTDTCPVLALQAWLKVRGESPGALFTDLRAHVVGVKGLHGQAIGDIVKRAVESIGLDSAHYGGHSLRAGFCTAASEAGVDVLMIADHTGHRCIDSLRHYLRRTNVFRANAAGKIGL